MSREDSSSCWLDWALGSSSREGAEWGLLALLTTAGEYSFSEDMASCDLRNVVGRSDPSGLSAGDWDDRSWTNAAQKMHYQCQ